MLGRLGLAVVEDLLVWDLQIWRAVPEAAQTLLFFIHQDLLTLLNLGLRKSAVHHHLVAVDQIQLSFEAGVVVVLPSLEIVLDLLLAFTQARARPLDSVGCRILA